MCINLQTVYSACTGLWPPYCASSLQLHKPLQPYVICILDLTVAQLHLTVTTLGLEVRSHLGRFPQWNWVNNMYPNSYSPYTSHINTSSSTSSRKVELYMQSVLWFTVACVLLNKTLMIPDLPSVEMRSIKNQYTHTGAISVKEWENKSYQTLT